MHLLADTLQAMEEEGWENGNDILKRVMREWQGKGDHARRGREDIGNVLEFRKQMMNGLGRSTI